MKAQYQKDEVTKKTFIGGLIYFINAALLDQTITSQLQESLLKQVILPKTFKKIFDAARFVIEDTPLFILEMFKLEKAHPIEYQVAKIGFYGFSSRLAKNKIDKEIDLALAELHFLPNRHQLTPLLKSIYKPLMDIVYNAAFARKNYSFADHPFKKGLKEIVADGSLNTQLGAIESWKDLAQETEALSVRLTTALTAKFGI